MSNCLIIILNGEDETLQACMDDFAVQLSLKCSTCGAHLSRNITFIQMPPVLAFDIGNRALLSLDPVIWITCAGDHMCYTLRGVIYFKDDHFTEHIITSTGMVWFHNGMFMGWSLLYKSQELGSITTDHASMALYTLYPPCS